MKGLPATHGVSRSHRSGGAIGCRNDPGRVWKGKKMPGKMGNERRTFHNCWVYKIDAPRNLIYVRGQASAGLWLAVLLLDCFPRWDAKRRQTCGV